MGMKVGSGGGFGGLFASAAKGGGKGKGKGKNGKGKDGKPTNWRKENKKRKAEKLKRKSDQAEKKARGILCDAEDGVQPDEECFWEPSWDTLGPLQAVGESTERNKLGQRVKNAGILGGAFTPAPEMISVKAVEAAAKARKEALAGGEVESRKRRQQRERRQRQLALTLGAPPGAQRPLSLKDSRRESGHSGAATTTAAQPAKLAHPQPAAAAIAQSSGPLKKGLLKKKRRRSSLRGVL